MKPRRDLQKQLFLIAESQQGLFTAHQAEKVGFIRTNHAYHVKKGDWVREERGIYRLALFPLSRDQQRSTYALWSRSRDGEVQGVYSHESALAFYDLSDVNPSKLHMTVPNSFRRSAKTPKVLVLHRADLEPAETQKGPGYRITTPLRTLEDVIASEQISFEFIKQAVQEAITRGLITRSEFRTLVAKLTKNGKTNFRQELDSLMRKVA